MTGRRHVRRVVPVPGPRFLDPGAVRFGDHDAAAHEQPHQPRDHGREQRMQRRLLRTTAPVARPATCQTGQRVPGRRGGGRRGGRSGAWHASKDRGRDAARSWRRGIGATPPGRSKHGILIVEFANQLHEQGRAKFDAVIEASVPRLRPILMTTGAMVLGSVPLAISTGAGAESRQAIGWVIVGGLTLGTLFTLFVVPTAYTLLARAHKPQPDAVPATPHPAE